VEASVGEVWGCPFAGISLSGSWIVLGIDQLLNSFSPGINSWARSLFGFVEGEIFWNSVCKVGSI
jgi:hypothetical protein